MNKKYSFTIVLIVVFIVLGVYEARANINPTDIKLTAALPMILKNWQDQNNQQTAAPSGSLYVFFSAGSTTGNAGGRTGMNTFCSNTDPASHFCSREELENAVQTTGA